MLNNRPSYLDYSSNSTSRSSTSNQTNTKTPQNPPESKQRTSPDSNSHEKIEEKPYNPFKKARKNTADYKINPDVIPRPRHVEDFYRNPTNKSNYYETNEDSIPPFSTSNFLVKETQNTSPRFMRPTLLKIPLEQDMINKSGLIFGLHIQPFAELVEGDSTIPRVEINDDIFRCTLCNTYVNNKFEIKYLNNSKRVAICNCCQYSIDISSSNNILKPEYLASDVSSVPELFSPTIDYVAPTKFLPKHSFSPAYGIFIDVSLLSIEMGFATYVIRVFIID